MKREESTLVQPSQVSLTDSTSLSVHSSSSLDHNLNKGVKKKVEHLLFCLVSHDMKNVLCIALFEYDYCTCRTTLRKRRNQHMVKQQRKKSQSWQKKVIHACLV